MHVIRARNVEHALRLGLGYLLAQGVRRGSRNGPVLVSEEPVTTVYERPRERVVLWPERDANPFFHLYESLWMLAGRRDVRALTRYVKRMETFSDDGVTLNAAYGHRWRRHFGGRDQLRDVINALRTNPDDRRCVLQIWDQEHDLATPTKDAACNVAVHFQRTYAGDLDMTVFCRSNDVVWGAYGANAVHFSYLQEFVASFVGCAVGRYWQISDNYHVYANVLEQLAPNGAPPAPLPPEEPPVYVPAPLVTTPWDVWHEELRRLLREADGQAWLPNPYAEPFFGQVARPMLRAHEFHRRGHHQLAVEASGEIGDQGWALAATMWLERRADRRRRVQEVR